MYISISNPNISIRTAEYEGKQILLIGGGDHKTAKATTYEESYGRLEKFAKKYYPDAKILKKWDAEDCISLDKLPYIGQASTFLPNVYVATGYKKWGMTFSSVATNIIVDSIRGIENPYSDIFSSLRLQPVKNYEEVKKITHVNFVYKVLLYRLYRKNLLLSLINENFSYTTRNIIFKKTCMNFNYAGFVTILINFKNQ